MRNFLAKMQAPSVSASASTCVSGSGSGSGSTSGASAGRSVPSSASEAWPGRVGKRESHIEVKDENGDIIQASSARALHAGAGATIDLCDDEDDSEDKAVSLNGKRSAGDGEIDAFVERTGKPPTPLSSIAPVFKKTRATEPSGAESGWKCVACTFKHWQPGSDRYLQCAVCCTPRY
jgi:hypothetical protein